MNIYKEKLFKLFPINSEGKNDDPKSHEDDDYLSIYQGIKNNIPFPNMKENLALCRFLYAACIKFDRFSVPTPYFIDPLFFKKKLEIFTRALIKAEGQTTPNSAFFLLRQLRADLFDEINLKSTNNLEAANFQKYSEMVNNMPRFARSIEKLKEYEDEINKIQALIKGIEDKSLITIYKFRVPYIIDERILNIKFSWNNIPCTFMTKNTFYPNRETFVNFENPTIPIGASRWQIGETEIIIEFQALVDSYIETDPLQTYLNAKTHPKWPSCFTYSYEILRDVHWKLRLEHKTANNLVPVPRDLSEIHSTIASTANSSIEWIIRNSPAFHFRDASSKNESAQINFEEIGLPSMHLRYRSTAQMYLELGLGNEAIFWLNAGIEAFFEYKFIEFSLEVHKDLLDEMKSGKPFWSEAEQIITDQQPEMAGKIKWPNVDMHASMYAKLKYVCKILKLVINKDVLIDKYRDINKYRNDLFHGRKDTSIEIPFVMKAFDSFDYLLENFKMQD